MTDLTEQWKKGELTEGWYWVKSVTWSECINMLYNWSDTFLDGDVPVDNDKIIEVLAPVPSFEEWQAKLEQNAQLKEQINHLLKTQARQFVDNQKLQVKAEKAKDVVNIDTARQIKQLKELLKECELWFTGMVGNMNDKNVGEHNKSVPIGNFEYIFKEFSQKINEVLK